MTANEAYIKEARRVRDQLSEVYNRLKAHELHQAKQPRNWGFVGDLEHVNEVLFNLLDTFGAEGR